MARKACKNNCLWVHTDYLSLSKGDIAKVKTFFESINHDKYKNIIFVSNTARQSYLNIFPQQKDVCMVCNNIINCEEIRNKSLETIEIQRDTRITTFLNVGRHFELSKKLSRLIEAAKKLKEENYKFRILLVGDGKDTEYYKQLVNKENLENEILFLGKKKNPYPYFKISDCLVLTSDYEGYPVVFLEAYILGLPIITTNVSDSMADVQGKYGYVTEKNSEDIYNYMKKIIEEGYTIQTRFNPEEYNKLQIEKIKKMF